MTVLPSPLNLEEAQTWASLLPSKLCDACRGRIFARLEPGLLNEERGRRLRGTQPPTPSSDCDLCEGIAGRYDRYAELCQSATTDFEYDSFLVGSILFAEIRQREMNLCEQLAERVPSLRATPEPSKASTPAFALAEFLKQEVNREVGKRLEARTGKRVDFQRPHLTFRLDTRFDHVDLQIASLCVAGRYRKHARDLPQTHWPCRACAGLGCRACNRSGRTYAESVEELVARPFVVASGAAGESFHGMGREDIDARMLGSGRPFVLELQRPHRRRLDWATLAATAAQDSGGRVEVLEARPVPFDQVAAYKAADPEKTYRARCRAEHAVAYDSLISALRSLRGATLDQRTPERVAHRRADLVRRRRILDLALVGHNGDRFELEIRAESGTYIKEFVSGDQGRTRPALADTLGVPVVVEELDVTGVHWME